MSAQTQKQQAVPFSVELVYLLWKKGLCNAFKTKPPVVLL
jgi:hypothetical protein